MITTEQIAREFEHDLNALVTYENLAFKLWANVGERQGAERTGNTVKSYINGDIKVSASSITANRLVMGVNQLVIAFAVPLNPPKTTVEQTKEYLQPIKNGQYWFVQEICGILSEYFQRYQAIEMEDADGDVYGVGIVAGVSIPQGVDLQAWTDNFIPVNVYVEMNIVQGGILSLNVGVELDGVAVPFQSFTPDRSGVLDPAVYAGSDASKVLLTASAFAAECSIPTNTVFASSNIAVRFLLQGDLNEAHFLKLVWGDETRLYLITITRETGGIQGATIASVTFRLAELQEDPELVGIPDRFALGYFPLDSSEQAELTFSVSAPCLAYIAGKAYELAAGAVTVPLSPGAIAYDEATGEYRVYLVTSAPVEITGHTFEVV